MRALARRTARHCATSVSNRRVRPLRSRAARDESAGVRRRFEVMALNFHRATGKWSVFACNPRAYSLLARGAPR